MLLPIENTPRDYAWGRRGAISELLGRPPTDAVEAELWLGAHPGSPARVVGESGTLADVVPQLPFLLKVLAAAVPLSLQVHPTAAQARAGFERENATGVPLDAPHRNYRDPHPKPELLVALSERFEALSGFRPAGEVLADLEAVGSPAVLSPLVDRLDGDATVGDALVWLLAGGPAVDEIVAVVSESGHPLAARIAALHPGDPGIVGALLLHHVVLERGEALYLPAGNAHAYLDGVALELMAPSDNVLRGGLTGKHVDAEELGRVLVRAAGPPPRLVPTALPGGAMLFDPGDPEAPFSLVLATSEATVPLSGPAIAFCLDGEFSLTGETSSVTVSRGDAVLVTADERSLRATGSGTLAIAR